MTVRITPLTELGLKPVQLESWEFLALFTEAEYARYDAALESGNVAMRRLDKMLLSKTGKIEGDHPIIIGGLNQLRQEGILDSDARRDALLGYLANG